MNGKIVIILIVIAAILLFSVIVYIFYSNSVVQKEQMQGLLSARSRGGPKTAEDVERIKRMTAVSKVVKRKESLDMLLFKAGMFTKEEKQAFQRYRLLAYFAFPPTICLLLYLALEGMVSPIVSIGVGLGLGGAVGMSQPRAKLDKAIRLRDEEIMFYLPLVIEEVSIGTSSGLDPGTCITKILDLSEIRGCHNAVTEMLNHVVRLVRTGMNLEDALKEVGEASGKADLKHSFLFIAQTVKHGGEIAKQLQDLGDSVAMNKQVMVEEKITALPVKATFPLFLVFGGFFLLLVLAVMLMLLSAFQEIN